MGVTRTRRSTGGHEDQSVILIKEITSTMKPAFIATLAASSQIASDSPAPQCSSQHASTPQPKLPLWLKIAFTAFMAVLVPVYTINYGWTNFLYFCDLALFLTLIGLWTENRTCISMAAVGILLPQALWCVDFAVQTTGHTFTGMTAYMFDSNRSLFLRGLSLFHGWLPFLLFFVVRRFGYEKRALWLWTGLAWAACLFSFFCLPAAGEVLPNPNTPVNVNYVWGMSDKEPQTWMPAWLYLIAWLSALLSLVYLPTHWVLKKITQRPAGE
jgi:hypothetical protein